MIVSLVLIVMVLYGVGTYLLLQRHLTRIVIGLAIVAHAANLMLLLGGNPGNPALGGSAAGPTADPLPQALALTSIVITFGVSALLLAYAYRSWQISSSDEVEDDVEDRRIATLAAIQALVDEEVVDAEEVEEDEQREEVEGVEAK
ncbi:MAG: sodium:proton antiporter [Acidimicrobiia bacterium]|nr:sodium:proton antiporter [Acidimicrobiia bacterium]